MAGAPHPEGGLTGQPAGERDGRGRPSGSTSTPSTSTRPSSGPATPRRPPPSCAVDRDAIKAELGQVLLAVEEAQAAAVTPRRPDSGAAISTAERDTRRSRCSAAPDLMDQVGQAFTTLGVVGEQHQCAHRVADVDQSPVGPPPRGGHPVVVVGGKSTLADAALALMPTEATVAYSAMTGQALYYLGESDLAHKVLSIAEEEGAVPGVLCLEAARVRRTAVDRRGGQGPATGRLVTNTYEVTGPVALLMTTTSAELDEELANRLLVLAVDEGRHQTRAVHVAQRRRRDIGGAGGPGQAGGRDRPARQRPAAAQSGGCGEPARAHPRRSPTARPATAGTTPSTSGSSGP